MSWQNARWGGHRGTHVDRGSRKTDVGGGDGIFDVHFIDFHIVSVKSRWKDNRYLRPPDLCHLLPLQCYLDMRNSYSSCLFPSFDGSTSSQLKKNVVLFLIVLYQTQCNPKKRINLTYRRTSNCCNAPVQLNFQRVLFGREGRFATQMDSQVTFCSRNGIGHQCKKKWFRIGWSVWTLNFELMNPLDAAITKLTR